MFNAGATTTYACNGATGSLGPTGPAGPPGSVVFGTTSGTAAEGNDPRLSDARAPLPGSAAYIQNGTTPEAASLSVTGSGTFAGALTAGTGAFTGALTAASFVGNGSGLTSVTAGRLVAVSAAPGAANAGSTGTIYFDTTSGALRYSDGSAWRAVAEVPSGPGASPSALAASCKAIKSADPFARSGIYHLGVAGRQAFPAYCDMDDDGGGWTLFYAGRNGNPRQLFSNLTVSDVNADCSHPQFDCVRLLAPDRDETNTEFAASCGGAMIKFRITHTTLSLLRDGTTAANGYQPIATTTIYGTLGGSPDTFYTGNASPGWLVLSGASGTTFASGYQSAGYGGCNFVQDRGALTALYWREF